jgi:hypothetical protein
MGYTQEVINLGNGSSEGSQSGLLTRCDSLSLNSYDLYTCRQEAAQGKEWQGGNPYAGGSTQPEEPSQPETYLKDCPDGQGGYFQQYADIDCQPLTDCPDGYLAAYKEDGETGYCQATPAELQRLKKIDDQKKAEIADKQQTETDRLRLQYTGSSYDDDDPCRYSGAYYENGVRMGAGLTPDECRQADQDMRAMGLDPFKGQDFEVFKKTGAVDEIAPDAFIPEQPPAKQPSLAPPAILPFQPTRPKPAIPAWAIGLGVAAVGLLTVPFILRG